MAMAAFQAYGVARGLEGLRGLVAQPGLVFEISTMLTLTAGTMLLVWLANQITGRGIGNGLVLVLAVGFLINLPEIAAVAMERARMGIISVNMITFGAALAVAITAIIVLVERAQRTVVIEFPQQTIGGTTLENRSADLAFKLNNAGLVPTVLAGWLIAILVLGIFVGAGADSTLLRQFGHGHPLFMIVFSVLVVLFALFYTAFVIDPDKASETLRTCGGVIPGIAPGEATAAYLDNVLSRITLVGAIYLALVFVVPEILIVTLGVPFYLGGASMLVIVCAALDIGAQFKQEAQFGFGG